MTIPRLFVSLLPVTVARLICVGLLAAQAPTPVKHLLARQYSAGEGLSLHISGTNERAGRTSRYDADLTGVVTTDSSGRFIERFAWSHLMVDGVPVVIDSALARQGVSLAPDVIPRLPDLRRFDPRLIAPALDFLTFYVDLWLAMKQESLVRPGDHRYLALGVKGSWADGRTVVLGEDGLDFDITLVAIDSAAGIARLLVRHVPPATLAVKLPAPWMATPVDQDSTTRAVPSRPNNWVQLAKTNADGVVSYEAGVGRETFDVTLTVSVADGRLLAATMENPVDVVERTCTDEALTKCGDATRQHIHRRIELRQRP